MMFLRTLLLQALLLLLDVLICQSERPGHFEHPTSLEKDTLRQGKASHGVDPIQAVKNSCAKCTDAVSLEQTVGLEWVLFPPHPFPNPIITFMCLPTPDSRNWDMDLDLPLCPPEAMESEVMKEKCQYVSDRKKETLSEYFARKLKNIAAVPVAFVSQMLTCAGCVLCKLGETIRKQWQRLFGITMRMLNRLKRTVGRTLKGYDHVSPEEQVQQDTTIQKMIRNGLDSSLLQVGDLARLRWNSSDMEIEECIRRKLQRHNSDPVEQVKHLSLMQVSMDQFEGSGELHRLLLEIQLNQTESLWQQKMQQLQPALKSDECREAFASMQGHNTVDFSINVEFPDLSGALYAALLGSPAGVLQALIPEVLLMAIPKRNYNLRRDKVADCLERVGPAFREETCFDERPFLACTVRTLQQVLQAAMRGRWWPIGDKLDSQFDKSFASIESSTRGTCLQPAKVLGDTIIMDTSKEEKSGAAREKPDEEYLQEKLENPDGVSDRLFNTRHCPMVKTLVDNAIEADNGLPSTVSYAIWVAGILNAGETCPDFTPFVASFCAERLKCVDEGKLNVARSMFQGNSQDSLVPFTPDYKESQTKRVKSAASYVDELRQVQSVDEQWYRLWSTVHLVETETASEHLRWNDTANMIIHGSSEKVDLTLVAEFWDAVNKYMLHRNAMRSVLENDFSRYPRTRRLFGMRTSYSRLGATWKDLVHRYRGAGLSNGSSTAPICKATKGADKSRLRKKANGNLSETVLGLNFHCCCWPGMICDQKHLARENSEKDRKGQVFNVVIGKSTNSGNETKSCCRIQKGKCGGVFQQGRFSREMDSKSACIEAAQAEHGMLHFPK